MNSRYCYSHLQSTIDGKGYGTPEYFDILADRSVSAGYEAEMTDDPLNMCLFDDVDKSLVGGVLGYRYGPSNENCQLYMADRCAKKWDGACEVASMNKTATFPNNATIRGNAMADPAEISGGSTVGAQLLHNAAQRRFCTFNNCSIQRFPFDPTNMASPTVTRINRSQYGCMPSCSVDPKTVDSDVLMNKCLANPTATLDTLVNICQTHARTGVSLKGTKIGKFCESIRRTAPSRLGNYYTRSA